MNTRFSCNPSYCVQWVCGASLLLSHAFAFDALVFAAVVFFFGGESRIIIYRASDHSRDSHCAGPSDRLQCSWTVPTEAPRFARVPPSVFSSLRAARLSEASQPRRAAIDTFSPLLSLPPGTDDVNRSPPPDGKRKAKAYNSCIAPKVAYRNCRGAGHDTERAGVGPTSRRLSLRPQADLWPTSQTHASALPFNGLSTPVIHVITWITTNLPTQKGRKAELAWLVDP